MKPIVTTGCVSLMLLSLVVLAANAAMGVDETFRLSAPRFWWDLGRTPVDLDGRRRRRRRPGRSGRRRPSGNDLGRENLASGQVGRGSRAGDPIR